MTSAAWSQKVNRTAETFRALIVAAKELNTDRNEARMLAQRIAGCDLSNWSIETVEKYLDLTIQHGRKIHKMSIRSRIREELESRLASETVEDFDRDGEPDELSESDNSDDAE